MRDLVEGPLTREEDKLTVKQCFDENHEWNPQSISFELLENVLNTIKATPFSYDQHSEDSPMWGFSKNGCFSLQPAYLLARGLNPLNLDTMPFTWVWKTEAPQRFNFSYSFVSI